MAFVGPPINKNDKYRVPPPKSIKEIPQYLKKVSSAFFSRLFYIFRIVWKAKPSILFIMLFCAIFSGMLPVIGAYITAQLLNTLADAYRGLAGYNDIVVILVWQFVYLVVHGIATQVNNTVNRLAGEIVANYIQVSIMTKSKDVDLASFDQPEFYEKLENANREAGMRPIQILRATFTTFSTIISIISFFAVLFAISKLAPLIIVVLAIPAAIVNFTYRRKNVSYMRHRSKERRQMTYYSGITVDKDIVKEVRLFGLADTFIERYKKVFSKYFSGLKKLIYGESAWNIGLSIGTVGANIIIFLYVAKKVVAGEIQVGDYSLYTGALNSIASGISTIVSSTATIYEGTLFIENLISFMKEKKNISPTVEPPAKPQRHEPHVIEFKHVTFRYPGNPRDILHDINLTFRSGETTALVGLNGAGKTTLIKLLTRLYDPTYGCIFLDNRDIREYDTEELYKLYGIIFQDFGKYAVTVGENIAFGNIYEPYSDEKVREAAVSGNISDYIDKKMPKGLDTPLMRYFEPEGAELSIGQWQKLAVSRAFYSDSDILILDEPTASLDAIAEQEIFNQFDMLRKDKLTVFVSHRLSSATIANRIVVLDNGTVAEIGSHKELIELKGKYYELFNAQASRYRDGE